MTAAEERDKARNGNYGLNLQSWPKVVGTMLTEYEITSYCFTSRLSLTLWVATMPPSPRINVGVSWWPLRTVCS